MTQEPESNWSDGCPDGLISTAAQLRTPRKFHQKKRWRLAAAVLSAALLSGITILVAPSFATSFGPYSPPPMAIECEVVSQNLPAYCNHRLTDVSLKRSISNHLLSCCGCRELYRSICGCEKQCPNRPRSVTLKPTFDR
jgi:hypothetical protein